MYKSLLAIGFFALSLPLAASEVDHSKPYAGFQDRAIKSLSDEDIAELRRGGGWGLALPAELNGKPGPAHLLELRDELQLSVEQVRMITKVFERMQTDAIAAGERFIESEAALSTAFEGRDLNEETLRGLLEENAIARSELRFVHLSRHLSTSDILTEAQIRQYQVLRGYAETPCENVPAGHDRERWLRHNGCD